MPPDDARKRKACQSCMRAKAKCSPFEDRLDLCYRCQRLNKECFFDETVRRRVPKTRSRVKQLEQRVDTLIDLLAANGHNTLTSQPPQSTPLLSTPENEADFPDINCHTTEPEPSVPPYITPAETPCGNSNTAPAFDAFDPVEAGVLEESHATILLKEFKESCILSFPFVVITASTDANALRHQEPFLFHAIMAVMTYRTPSVQRALAEAFRDQIASRIIGHSHKSLEILQGLLVYGAWYHSFYRPENQQLAIVIQLCVAMIQDLGLSKNPKDKPRKMTLADDQCGLLFPSERSAAGKRAFLGTYYLTVAFSQAWRKRGTMSHTRFMYQCCQSLAERQEVFSDALITPFIQLSELMCRVNDYFSYDDIENAEVRGEMMLEITTTNFRNELDRIRNGLPKAARENTTLKLKFCLLETWIHECSLHTSLWVSSQSPHAETISPVRLKTLHRCLSAMKSYLTTLLSTPQMSLHHLAFPSWSGWFYAIIVACKLVFLADNEQHSPTGFDRMPRELTNLLPQEFGPGMPHDFSALPTRVPAMELASWDPVVVAHEAEVYVLFEKLAEKLKFTVPSNPDAWTKRKEDSDPLFSIACLQRCLLHGFTKRMMEYTTSNSSATNGTSVNARDESDTHTNTAQPAWDQATPHIEYLRQRIEDHPIPLIDTLHFNSLNFDSIALPEPVPGLPPQTMYNDWVWDMVMDDFTIPPL